jgi:F0F1-type ATP synthase assembly protein I
MSGQPPRRAGAEATAAWAAVGRLIAGPLLYGGLGYLVDRWLGTAPAFMATGIIFGFAAAIYLVIATSHPAGEPPADDLQETDGGA